jgi:hypothetical protein
MATNRIQTCRTYPTPTGRTRSAQLHQPQVNENRTHRQKFADAEAVSEARQAVPTPRNGRLRPSVEIGITPAYANVGQVAVGLLRV